MTTPKAWVQRETKSLVHEFRSKAHRRLNMVILVCFLIMVIYRRVGRAAVSIEVAERVPMLWKCLVFLAMFATIAYADWRIQRRIRDLSLPALERGWFIWLAVATFAFAVVTANARPLFYAGTFLCVPLSFGFSTGITDGSLMRQEKPNPEVERTTSQPTGSLVKATLLGGWLAVAYFDRSARK